MDIDEKELTRRIKALSYSVKGILEDLKEQGITKIHGKSLDFWKQFYLNITRSKDPQFVYDTLVDFHQIVFGYSDSLIAMILPYPVNNRVVNQKRNTSVSLAELNKKDKPLSEMSMGSIWRSPTVPRSRSSSSRSRSISSAKSDTSMASYRSSPSPPGYKPFNISQSTLEFVAPNIPIGWSTSPASSSFVLGPRRKRAQVKSKR